MTAQGIYINVSRRNDDLPQLIEEYSEQFNLSKADTVAVILRAYPKLIAYKQKVMEEECSLPSLFCRSLKWSTKFWSLSINDWTNSAEWYIMFLIIKLKYPKSFTFSDYPERCLRSLPYQLNVSLLVEPIITYIQVPDYLYTHTQTYWYNWYIT